tara:strand:+ start:227 stop:721 length:495 start_codon:yes stop_codon:yes gene_type:complete
MGRKRTSRTKKKRNRRMKGGSTGSIDPDHFPEWWLGPPPVGETQTTMRTIDKLHLEEYFNDLNRAIVNLKTRTEPELPSGTSGIYSYDRGTRNTFSENLFRDMKRAFGIEPVPKREHSDAIADIDAMNSAYAANPDLVKQISPNLMLDKVEKQRLRQRPAAEGQ